MTKLRLTPYEKFVKNGAESLSDVELLSIIIRNGTRKKDAIFIADELLKTFDSNSRIIGLMNVSHEDLKAFDGIGDVKAMCIECILELGKRIHKQNKEERLSFNSPVNVADCYMEQLRHLQQEHIFLLLLDVKGKLIKEIIISKGSINSSVISTRDIFINALNYKSSGFVLLHNHPSGDSSPSDQDLKITSKIKMASDFMDIKFVDHIIIGDKNYFSFKNYGYI